MALIDRLVVGVELPEHRPWDAANLRPPTRIAVREAFQLAHAGRIQVTLVAVLPEIKAGWFGSQVDAEVHAAQDRVEAEAVLDDLKQQYSHSDAELSLVDTRVVHGHPWYELMRSSGNDRRTMIVCGTRDTGVVQRILFGSTGQKLLRNSACPVLLVKPRLDDDSQCDMLVATDLSDVGMDVLQVGLAVASFRDSPLHALHVVEIPNTAAMLRTGLSDQELADLKDEKQREGLDELRAQIAQTDHRRLTTGVTPHVAVGDPQFAILEMVRKLDIDLLVIASRARGGIPGVLLGNTAERLLGEVPCSLLVIKPDDFVSPVELPDRKS